MCAMFDGTAISQQVRRKSSSPEQLMTKESQPHQSATQAHVQQHGISKKHAAHARRLRSDTKRQRLVQLAAAQAH